MKENHQKNAEDIKNIMDAENAGKLNNDILDHLRAHFDERNKKKFKEETEKVKEKIVADLLRLPQEGCPNKIEYLGAGSFNFAFKVKIKDVYWVYKISKYNAGLRRSTAAGELLYPHQLDAPQRAERLFNEMLDGGVYGNKGIPKAYLPKQQECLGCFFPFLDGEKLSVLDTVKLVVDIYGKTDRILLDAEIGGNAVRSKNYGVVGTDLNLAIGLERKKSETSEKAKRAKTLLERCKARRKELCGSRKGLIHETTLFILTMENRKKNKDKIYQKILKILEKAENSKKDIKWKYNYIQLSYFFLKRDIKVDSEDLDKIAKFTPSRRDVFFSLLLRLDDIDKKNGITKERVKKLITATKPGNESLLKNLTEHIRCVHSYVDSYHQGISFLSTHGKTGQTDIHHYIERILKIDDNNKKQIEKKFAEETRHLLSGSGRHGYKSSTTMNKNSGKAIFFTPLYNIKEKICLKRIAHSNPTLILTALATVAIITVMLGTIATGGALPSVFLLLAPLLKPLLGSATAATVSKASLSASCCFLPMVTRSLLATRKVSIKSLERTPPPSDLNDDTDEKEPSASLNSSSMACSSIR